jgi:hypothetical protein
MSNNKLLIEHIQELKPKLEDQQYPNLYNKSLQNL